MDSGGARGMLIDLADKMNVPLADIGPQTAEKLSGLLEYGLETGQSHGCLGHGP